MSTTVCRIASQMEQNKKDLGLNTPGLIGEDYGSSKKPQDTCNARRTSFTRQAEEAQHCR